MKVETKFSIGDNAWTLCNGIPTRFRVVGVYCSFVEHNDQTIKSEQYSLEGVRGVECADALYKTKKLAELAERLKKTV